MGGNGEEEDGGLAARPPNRQVFGGEDGAVPELAADFAGGDVYEGGEGGARADEVFAKAASDHARAPDEHGIPSGEGAAQEVMGFGTEEVFDGVAAVGAGEAGWALPPGEEGFRDFGKFRSGEEQPQPQVVIFRPAVILVAADFFCPGFAKHDTGVGKRAFDEDFAANVGVGLQAVHPIQVALKPTLPLLKRKTFDETADDGYAGMLI